MPDGVLGCKAARAPPPRLPRASYWVLTPENDAERSAAAIARSWLASADAYYVVAPDTPSSPHTRPALFRLNMSDRGSQLGEAGSSLRGQHPRNMRPGRERDARLAMLNRFLRRKVLTTVGAMCDAVTRGDGAAGGGSDYHLMLDTDTAAPPPAARTARRPAPR